MNRVIIFIALILLTFKGLGQNYMYVNTDTLYVRENAGEQYKIVGEITKGDKVTAVIEIESWTQIETETGLKGYVATTYLIPSVEENKGNDKNFSFLIFILILTGMFYFIIKKIKRIFACLFER